MKNRENTQSYAVNKAQSFGFSLIFTTKSCLYKIRSLVSNNFHPKNLIFCYKRTVTAEVCNIYKSEIASSPKKHNAHG